MDSTKEDLKLLWQPGLINGFRNKGLIHKSASVSTKKQIALLGICAWPYASMHDMDL